MIALWFSLGLLAGLLAWYLFEKSQRPHHPVSPGLQSDITLPHSQEWEVYQNSLSLCSKKLRVCMAELDLPYADHHVHLIETERYGNLSREFLRINPAFTVPVLLHNGHPIYESHEQIRYAAEHAGPAGEVLRGRDPETRAEVDRWVDSGALTGLGRVASEEQRAGNDVPGLTVPIFATMMQYIPYWRLIEGFLFHPDRRRPLLFAALKIRGLENLPAPALKLLQSARSAMHAHLDGLEQHLAHGEDWICGSDFTLADVSWMVILERLDEADWASVFWGQGLRPRLTAYWERLTKRPSYERALLSQRGEIQRAALEDIRAAKRASPALRALLEGS